jgi:hypothetical protein
MLSQSLKWILFTFFALAVALGAGLLYWGVQELSATFLKFQFLFYPGIAAGIVAGFILYHIKDTMDLENNMAMFLIALCAGVIVFSMRWIPTNGISYHGKMYYLSTRSVEDSGQTQISPGISLLLFLGEGFLTIFATVKFTLHNSLSS